MIIDPDTRPRYDSPAEEDQPVHVTTSFKLELKNLVRNSLPTLVTFLLQNSLLLVIPIYFAGKQGKDVLSASSMAINLFYISGPALVFGFCTAEDTLCSTAFGAKSYTKVGLYYQRSILILHIMFIPIALLWMTSGPLLRVFSPELADMCIPILRLMVLAIPALIVFECSKRYLLSQNKFRAPTLVLAGAIPFSLIFNMAFERFYLGPALSLVLTYWAVSVLVVTYIYFDDRQCWNSDLRLSVLLQDWGQFSIGLSGIIMVCAAKSLMLGIGTGCAMAVQSSSENLAAAPGGILQYPTANSFHVSLRRRNISATRHQRLSNLCSAEFSGSFFYSTPVAADEGIPSRNPEDSYSLDLHRIHHSQNVEFWRFSKQCLVFFLQLCGLSYVSSNHHFLSSFLQFSGQLAANSPLTGHHDQRQAANSKTFAKNLCPDEQLRYVDVSQFQSSHLAVNSKAALYDALETPPRGEEIRRHAVSQNRLVERLWRAKI
ncbi:hypothetical protein KL939_004213 [Ogataea angusta]|nr:hypothetical protein KL939_004213 [Ogataea angusta]